MHVHDYPFIDPVKHGRKKKGSEKCVNYVDTLVQVCQLC